MPDTQERQIQKTAIQVLMYRVAAIMFAFGGVFAFVGVYINYSNGDAAIFFQRPLILLLMLLPFLPAYALVIIADKKKSKLSKMLSDHRSGKS